MFDDDEAPESWLGTRLEKPNWAMAADMEREARRDRVIVLHVAVTRLAVIRSSGGSAVRQTGAMHDDGADGPCLEVHFPEPDEPYLFAAALRQRLGDSALNLAWVIPSPDGPAVLLSASLLDDLEVRALMELLEGQVAADAHPQQGIGAPLQVDGLQVDGRQGHADGPTTGRAPEARRAS